MNRPPTFFGPVRGSVGLATLLFLSACLGPQPETTEPPAPDPDAGLTLSGASFDMCPTTLHVWLVPLRDLESKTPPQFPPAVYKAEGEADTPLGRVVFYLYDCRRVLVDGVETGPGLFGLLGVRVVAPPNVRPPTQEPPWATFYLVHAMASEKIDWALSHSGIPWQPVEGNVQVEATPLPDAPTAASRVISYGITVFESTMQGVPGQVENFSRPERWYRLEGTDLRWVDVDFHTTLWETEGRVTYAQDSPWARTIGAQAYDVPVDHHAMQAKFRLSWSQANLRP